MKLQSASRKEICRISLGTLVCDGIMFVGLFLLSQFGMGKFDLPRILLGAVCGSIIAVLNLSVFITFRDTESQSVVFLGCILNFLSL